MQSMYSVGKMLSQHIQRALSRQCHTVQRSFSTTTHAHPCLSLSLTQLAEAYKNKTVSVSTAVESCMKQLQDNSKLNICISTAQQSQLAQQIAASQQRMESATPLSPLDGVPIMVKDNFCMKDTKTSAGSRMLDSFNSPYTATVVQRLTDAGAIVLGKANMDEFGMGSSNSNSHYGKTVNPWSTSEELSPGGSSGGSAAAVAARTCYGALGSDTGGSIRLPASYCGLVGLKPTYGRLSRYGMIAYGSSMDCPSIITRTVQDARAMLAITEGYDSRDSTSVHAVPVTQSLPPLPADSLRGLTIGIPAEYHFAELSQDVVTRWHETAASLADAGATLVQLSLPSTSLALPCYYILSPAEASSNLSRYDGVEYGYSHSKATAVQAQLLATAAAAIDKTGPPAGYSLQSMYTENRSHGFGDEVKRRILIGTYVMSSKAYQSYLEKAQQIRSRITQEFQNAFQQKVDLILTPTATSPALSFKQIEEEQQQNPVSAYYNDVFTIPANLAGLPAISVPTHLMSSAHNSRSLPLGMQLIGQYHSEGTLLHAAQIMEKYAKFALP